MDQMGALMWMVVLGTSIWVHFDANAFGFGKREVVPRALASGAWSLARLALWIFSFPAKLAKRVKYKRVPDQPTIDSSLSPVLLAFFSRGQLTGAERTMLSDAITQIKRLGQLRNQGIISEDEFATKKRELLG
jgi:Short C-terminal domain